MEGSEKKGHIQDAAELKEVLKAVREEVPGLLREITDPVRSLINAMTPDEEQAKARAKAIAVFYKELLASGIEKDIALKMTEEQFVNPVGVLGQVMEKRRKHEDED